MLDDKLKELRNSYYESIISLTNMDDIIHSLPSYESFSNYKELIEGLINKLNSMINEYNNLLNTNDDDLKELLQFEINKFNSVIEICKNLIKDNTI